MNAPLPQKQFFVALAILALVHTVVSGVAYALLTRTTVQDWPEGKIVENTTPEQAGRGERSFMTNKRVISRSVPWPVPCYILGGYAGLCVALVIWLVHQARVAHP